MTPIRKQMLTLSLLAGIGMAAFAQTPPPMADGPMQAHGMHHGARGPADRARMQERMQERMAKRQAALKQKLQITPAQEPAWNSFTSAMKPPANMQRPDHAAIAKLSTPERIDQMRALRNQRIAEMDRRADATKSFYAALTPEQKKVFDEQALRRGGRHGEHGPRGHGGHHGRG